MSQTEELNAAIAGNFMLVKVGLRKWSGKQVDRSLSQELENSKAAKSGSLKTVKNLLAGADDELREVNSALDSIRTFTYNRTLPWATSSDGAMRGPRLLPVKDTVDFLKDYKALVAHYQVAKQAFLDVYDSRRQQALANLGGAGNPADYPTVQEIDSQFNVDIDLGVVPAVNDFSRLPIPADTAHMLGQRMASKQEQAIHNAMNDLFKRMLESVQRMATQLGKHADEGNARLYKTMVQNVRDINALLKAANVSGNEQLRELAERIESDLCPHDVEVYKANPGLAKQVSEKATLIAGDIENAIEWY